MADHIHLANGTQMPLNRIWRNVNRNHQTILTLNPTLTHCISYFCDFTPLQYISVLNRVSPQNCVGTSCFPFSRNNQTYCNILMIRVYLADYWVNILFPIPYIHSFSTVFFLSTLFEPVTCRISVLISTFMYRTWIFVII